MTPMARNYALVELRFKVGGLNRQPATLRLHAEFEDAPGSWWTVVVPLGAVNPHCERVTLPVTPLMDEAARLLRPGSTLKLMEGDATLATGRVVKVCTLRTEPGESPLTALERIAREAPVLT
jgi:hypothetical protein